MLLAFVASTFRALIAKFIIAITPFTYFLHRILLKKVIIEAKFALILGADLAIVKTDFFFAINAPFIYLIKEIARLAL